MPEDTRRLSQMVQTDTFTAGALFYVAKESQTSESGFESFNIPGSDMARTLLSSLQFPLVLQTEAKSVIPAINELNAGKQNKYIEFTEEVDTGETTVTITDEAITTDSTVDIYTDVFGINPTSVAVTQGEIEIDFEAQEDAFNVKVRIS